MVKIEKINRKFSVKVNGEVYKAGMNYRQALQYASSLTGLSSKVLHLNR